MQTTNRLKNQHLLWRSAFGPMAENAASLDDLSQKKLWELLLKTSAKKPTKIVVADNLVDGLVNGVGRLVGYGSRQLRLIQSGQVGNYILIMVLAMVVFFLIWFNDATIMHFFSTIL